MKTRQGFAEAVATAKAAGADFCLDQALDVARGSTKETVSRDRLEVSVWQDRADRIGAGAAGEATEAKPQRVEIVFYARRFEKVIGPDGRAYTREVTPEDDA
jgi:hypothetical protein